MNAASPAERAAAHRRPGAARSPVVIFDGALELLKWFALVCMTLDHVNKYALASGQAWMYEAGRLAMPIFAVVLAYNLARPGALEPAAFKRLCIRLGAAAIVASLPYSLLAMATWGLAWPVNILWTLLAGALIVRLIALGTHGSRVAAAALFGVAGTLVEFWWPALLLVVASWLLTREPTRVGGWVALVLALAGINAINGNYMALAAVLPLWLATQVRVNLPRLRWAFYVYYPAHLAVLVVLGHVPAAAAGL